MTTRKPKPKSRKASVPTLEQRVARLEKDSHPPVYNHVPDILARLDALETRKRFRDKSHDEPVSNANEAVSITSDMMVKVKAKGGGFRWAWWRP